MRGTCCYPSYRWARLAWSCRWFLRFFLNVGRHPQCAEWHCRGADQANGQAASARNPATVRTDDKKMWHCVAQEAECPSRRVSKKDIACSSRSRLRLREQGMTMPTSSLLLGVIRTCTKDVVTWRQVLWISEAMLSARACC